MIYWFIISSLWFGIWATLSRLEFKYAGLNVGKNKFGLNFFIWNMQAWMAKINLGLNVGKNKSGLFFYFFGWATNWAQSLNGARLGRVRATGLVPWVRFGYEKTRPEPDPLPFLLRSYRSRAHCNVGQAQFLYITKHLTHCSVGQAQYQYVQT